MGRTARPPRPVPHIETDLPPIEVDFRDVAEEAGLTARHVAGDATRKRYILETTGNGVAVFDYDGDGLMDIFLANGTTLDAKDRDNGAAGYLYRNRGGLRFEEVTERAGLTRVGWGQGVCVGDYDNDGHRDLLATHYGRSVLYRNRGDGTFRDVTAAAGLRSETIRWDAGCTFVDYDLDGRLDLMMTGYLQFDRAKVPAPGSGGYCQWKGVAVLCGPRGLPFTHHLLFRNNGDGTFTDASDASGVGRSTGCYGFTVVTADFDSDGRPDLYVACDSTPSLLYLNQGDGTFEEAGLLAGVALNEDGQEQGGMGIAVADYDEDGHVDIVKTNFSDDVPNLYHNNGDGTFEDRVYQAGLGAHMDLVGWGVHFLDVDHDGLKDLLVVNGHVYPEADTLSGLHYRQPRLLYWHVGDGRFKDISADAGAGIADARSSRGSAVGDLDNDGTLEVVISNMGERPSLLKNFGPTKNWLLVKAEGVASNRDAIGARIVVHANGRQVSGQVQSGGSFISQSDFRVHIGLGDVTKYERLEVIWPGGVRELFPGGKANQVVVVSERTGRKG